MRDFLTEEQVITLRVAHKSIKEKKLAGRKRLNLNGALNFNAPKELIKRLKPADVVLEPSEETIIQTRILISISGDRT